MIHWWWAPVAFACGQAVLLVTIFLVAPLMSRLADDYPEVDHEVLQLVERGE